MLLEGKRDSAEIVKELLQASCQWGTKVKKCKMSYQPTKTTISSGEVLALMIDANFPKHQYNVIREQGNKCVKKCILIMQ